MNKLVTAVQQLPKIIGIATAILNCPPLVKLLKMTNIEEEPEEEFCDDCGDSIGQEPWGFLCWRCRELIDEEDLMPT